MDMQVKNVSMNNKRKQPNFQALKSIKFCNELQNNAYAKNELLKIFDHQPVKDLFTKFDAEVAFNSSLPNMLRSLMDGAKNLGDNYSVVCNINLTSKGMEKIFSHFKDLANNAGVNINDSIDKLVQQNARFELSANYIQSKKYNNIEELQKLINSKEKELSEASKKLAEYDAKNSNIKYDSEERLKLIGDKIAIRNLIDNYKYEMLEIKDEITFYEQNKDISNNPLALASRLLVSNLQKMSSEEIYKKIPDTMKSNEILETKLNQSLQKAIIDKNVETKLKELLGENYIEPKKQAKTNITKKNGINIEKPIHKPQEVEEMGVSKGRKTRKPSVKNSDKE